MGTPDGSKRVPSYKNAYSMHFREAPRRLKWTGAYRLTRREASGGNNRSALIFVRRYSQIIRYILWAIQRRCAVLCSALTARRFHTIPHSIQVCILKLIIIIVIITQVMQVSYTPVKVPTVETLTASLLPLSPGQHHQASIRFPTHSQRAHCYFAAWPKFQEIISTTWSDSDPRANEVRRVDCGNLVSFQPGLLLSRPCGG